MQKQKKFILFFLLMIFITVIGIYFINQNKNSKKSDLNEIIESVISYNIEDFSQEKKEKIKLKVKKFIKDTKNKTTLSQGYYILGFLSSLETNYEEAITYYKKSLDNFRNINNTEIEIQIYYELSRMYLYESYYKESSDAFEKMKEIAFNYNKKDEVVKYGIKRGYDIYCRPDGSKESVEILEETLELAEKINYQEIEDVYFNLGRAYWSSDRFIESINSKLEALDIVNTKKLEEKIATISTDIGIDYLYSGNYEEALIYLQRVLEYNLKDEEKDAKAKSYSLINICETYIKLEQFEDASEAFELLRENIEKQKNGLYKEDNLTYMYVDKADLQTLLGNPAEALKLLDLANSRYKKRDKFSFYDLDVKMLEEYGDAYYALADYNKALQYHKEAEKISKLRQLTYLEEDYNAKIYLDYKALGDRENTIKYLEKNNQLKSNLSKEKNKQYYKYIYNEFENDVNLNKISKLKEQKKNTKILSYILGGGIIVISYFGFNIFMRNREINRLNKLFKNLSVTDPLTKLANRRALDEFLAGNWALYKKTKMPISFMMIDIDYFKKYNDNYGHLKGDEALGLVAACISNICDKGDFIARYGGEEFIIIMLNTDKELAINYAKKIIENIYNLNIEHKYSSISERLTLSMGITTCQIGSIKNYDDYIKKADLALYEAKESGKNKYVFLD